MRRIDDPSAVASMPVPEASGTEGFFTEGVPGTLPATLVRASWLNAIQEELMAIIIASGQSSSKTDVKQLLKALNSTGVFQTPALFDNTTRVATMAAVRNELLGLGGAPYVSLFGSLLAPSGTQRLPGGYLRQWGLIGSVPQGGSVNVSFPVAFPNAAYMVIPVLSGQGVASNVAFSPGASTPTLTGVTIFNNGSNGAMQVAYEAFGK